MKLFTGLFLVSSLSIGIFFGCSKADNGATGAQGPTGPQGATGNTNANVKAIKDSVTSSSGWTYVTPYWYTFFPNLDISGSFISDGGFVQVFLSTDHGATWTVLPNTYVGSTLSAQWTYSYSSLPSGTGVYIYFTWSDQMQHTDPYASYSSAAYFNVICIAPSVLNKYPGTNWNNYQALMRIPELRQQNQ